MGGGMLYEIWVSSGLLSMGVYQLISTTRNYLKSHRDYYAKPYHPLPLSNQTHQWLLNIQLYLILFFLIVAIAHQTLISTYSDPLLLGHTPVHLFTSLQSLAILFLFLILTLSVLFSTSTFSPDLFFALASAIFYLQYSVSSSSASLQISSLEAKCDSLSARISALSSFFSLLLACQPKLFVADLALAASFSLHGLWALQTGLTLHVDAFIPQGCHKLLDVVGGVEGSTKCDLDDSNLRAAAILDLLFVIHVLFVVLIIILTYAAVSKFVGNTARRFGSYEALPTVAASSSAPDSSHIQMKSITGTQA